MSEADARATRLALERLLADEPAAALLDLPRGALDRLERYVALLLAANRRLNLTRIVAADDIARLHLLDALAALPIVDELGPSDVVDLGAGGGVPGVVLAIARPAVAFTLVDSARRKADALRAVADELRLGNVGVLAERAEALGRRDGQREVHDMAVARACAPLPVLVEYALPLLRPGGSLLAWKGRLAADERAAGAAAAAALGGTAPEERPTDIGALGDHRFVIVRRGGPLPSRYPRRPGVPSRAPLG